MKGRLRALCRPSILRVIHRLAAASVVALVHPVLPGLSFFSRPMTTQTLVRIWAKLKDKVSYLISVLMVSRTAMKRALTVAASPVQIAHASLRYSVTNSYFFYILLMLILVKLNKFFISLILSTVRWASVLGPQVEVAVQLFAFPTLYPTRLPSLAITGFGIRL